MTDIVISDFRHNPPEGYYYSFEDYKSGVIRIWLHNTCKFDYNHGEETRTVWGFALNIDDPKYFYVIKDDVPFMRWEWDNLLSHYLTKFENLIVVDADVKKVSDVEHFHYVGFNHYQDTSKDLFRKMIEDNKICVDLRLYTQYNENKGVRNRGTALRIKHRDVKDLYNSQEYFS